jgi:hypothetical protein
VRRRARPEPHRSVTNNCRASDKDSLFQRPETARRDQPCKSSTPDSIIVNDRATPAHRATAINRTAAEESVSSLFD